MANHLADETSLYLKQHANNPVDWYPWGPEALQRAKELDRPIFLSIGYSACHWCHVMEHESFENEATARILNEHFICIKVDREERPDLDAIYMNALQALTREGGGWPLSVFLSPDLTPFFAGTYFPPDDRYAGHGKPSFPRLLAGIIEAWRERRDHIREVGQSVAEFLNDNAKASPGEGRLAPDILERALAALKRGFDPVHGGFGHAPKFPHTLELRLLMRIEKRFGGGLALHLVRHTLDKMARGGIHDQIGGGFHRYSVDERWLVPHFEKMLYDNALLAATYAEAWQLTQDPFYWQIARQIHEYIDREMTAPEGSFFSTQDADSEGEEGKFYVWSEREARDILGPELGEFACKVWALTAEGNFEGHNILCRARGDAEDARRLGMEPQQFASNLEQARTRLREVRSRRVWPGRDEKILTAWNGLMIGARAIGRGFEPRSPGEADRAADFVLERLRGPDGRLFRTIGVGLGQPAKYPGYLEDYACLADGLITLYQSCFVPRYLEAAVQLAEHILRHFADPNGPGFFFTADDHEQLIARTKDLHDGSTPSGNAVATIVFLKLAKLCGRNDFFLKAEETLRGFQATMTDYPSASGQMLAALDFYLGPVQEVAVIGGTDDPGTKQVLRAFHAAYRPNAIIAFHDPTSGEPPEFIPLLKDRPMMDGQATVYICKDYVCGAPLIGAAAALPALAQLATSSTPSP